MFEFFAYITRFFVFGLLLLFNVVCMHTNKHEGLDSENWYCKIDEDGSCYIIALRLSGYNKNWRLGSRIEAFGHWIGDESISGYEGFRSFPLPTNPSLSFSWSFWFVSVSRGHVAAIFRFSLEEDLIAVSSSFYLNHKVLLEKSSLELK